MALPTTYPLLLSSHHPHPLPVSTTLFLLLLFSNLPPSLPTRSFSPFFPFSLLHCIHLPSSFPAYSALLLSILCNAPRTRYYTSRPPWPFLPCPTLSQETASEDRIRRIPGVSSRVLFPYRNKGCFLTNFTHRRVGGSRFSRCPPL